MKSFRVDLTNSNLSDLSIVILISAGFTFLLFVLISAGLAALIGLEKSYVYPGAIILWAGFWIWILCRLRKIIRDWDDTRFSSKALLLIPILLILITVTHPFHRPKNLE